MEAGPATIRAHDELAPTLARMAERHVAVLLVTTPEGTLLGALRAPHSTLSAPSDVTEVE
jgi:hypothetical protein